MRMGLEMVRPFMPENILYPETSPVHGGDELIPKPARHGAGVGAVRGFPHHVHDGPVQAVVGDGEQVHLLAHTQVAGEFGRLAELVGEHGHADDGHAEVHGLHGAVEAAVGDEKYHLGVGEQVRLGDPVHQQHVVRHRGVLGEPAPLAVPDDPLRQLAEDLHEESMPAFVEGRHHRAEGEEDDPVWTGPLHEVQHGWGKGLGLSDGEPPDENSVGLQGSGVLKCKV